MKMRQHLGLTTKEAVARLQGNWTAYDQVHAEILSMSHMLSSGVIRQFPSRFQGRGPAGGGLAPLT